jgi:hypothetical protein
MTATALQFDFDAPARRLPVRRTPSLTLVGGDRPVAAGRGLTFDDVLVEGWERLRAGRAAGCPVCGSAMSAVPARAGGAPSGHCGDCGSTLG